jgi:hypothetical protein
MNWGFASATSSSALHRPSCRAEFIDSLAFAGRRLADQSTRNGLSPQMPGKDITDIGLPTRLFGLAGLGAPLKAKTKTA